ncbi:hypothetical protein BLX41_07565 [Pseudomonas protegens]|nr:hypothetical protein BLX41_07565 [Pseudomonas protegens]
MQLERLGCFSIDLLEKLQPLLMPMLIFNTPNQMPLKLIQDPEQRSAAMTHIIVRLHHAPVAPSRFTDARLSDWLKDATHSFEGQKRFTAPPGLSSKALSGNECGRRKTLGRCVATLIKKQTPLY